MDFIKEITCIQAVGTSDDEARKYGYESWIDYCHKVNMTAIKTIKFGNSLKFMVTIYAACLTTLQNDKF